MASVDETFDPNDLDSIDALLDEAEQEVAEQKDEAEPDEASIEETAQAVENEEVAEEAAPESVSEEALDDLLDSAEQEAEADQPESQPEERAAAPTPKEPESRERAFKEEGSEDFLSKRAAAQNSPNNGLSAAEMEAIKKLVIIFGSVLTVLALVAIGIGLWGALSSGGLDEESKTMIEDIRAGTEQNTLASTTNNQTMQSVEKKMDALSFQIEQLTSDIVALEKANGQPQAVMLEKEKDQASKQTKEEMHTAVKAVQSVAAQSMPPSKLVVDKLNSVNGKVTTVQRRAYEINKRVKKLQGQYSELMHSLKKVEKQMLEQAKKAAKKEQEAEKKKAEQIPGYPYYESGNVGSYP